MTTCKICAATITMEPDIGWVDTLSGDDGGTYDLCPERPIDTSPVLFGHLPAKPCEHPTDCTAPAEFWVAGAHAGDWAVHVCAEHREWAHAALAPWVEERLPS